MKYLFIIFALFFISCGERDDLPFLELFVDEDETSDLVSDSIEIAKLTAKYDIYPLIEYEHISLKTINISKK